METATFIKSVELLIVPTTYDWWYQYYSIPAIPNPRAYDYDNADTSRLDLLATKERAEIRCAILNGRRYYYAMHQDACEVIAMHVDELVTNSKTPKQLNNKAIKTVRAIDLDI